MGRISKEELKKRKKSQNDQQWKKENTFRVCVHLFNATDTKVIDRLKSVDNKTDYIRRLILEDIERSKQQ